MCKLESSVERMKCLCCPLLTLVIIPSLGLFPLFIMNTGLIRMGYWVSGLKNLPVDLSLPHGDYDYFGSSYSCWGYLLSPGAYAHSHCLLPTFLLSIRKLERTPIVLFKASQYLRSQSSSRPIDWPAFTRWPKLLITSVTLVRMMCLLLLRE